MNDFAARAALLNAVAREGSSSRADKLHRTHPDVFAAFASSERQLGLRFWPEVGYRVGDRGGGRFTALLRACLREHRAEHRSAQLAMGQESEAADVIGDSVPV